MNKTVFAIITILFNQLGVPCFLQGQTKLGILRLILNPLTLGVIGIINFVKGIILGIEILKMTEEEYQEKFPTLNSGFPAMK